MLKCTVEAVGRRVETCGLQRSKAYKLLSASSSGLGLASARFIAVSKRCSDDEKIDGYDMEVGKCFGGRCVHGLPTEVRICGGHIY